VLLFCIENARFLLFLSIQVERHSKLAKTGRGACGLQVVQAVFPTSSTVPAARRAILGLVGNFSRLLAQQFVAFLKFFCLINKD